MSKLHIKVRSELHINLQKNTFYGRHVSSLNTCDTHTQPTQHNTRQYNTTTDTTQHNNTQKYFQIILKCIFNVFHPVTFITW